MTGPDAGRYVLEVRLPRERLIRVGQLGARPFAAGAYLYVGSAARCLGARLARHAARRKTERWHIDYLTTRGNVSRAAVWPVAAAAECELAAAVSNWAGEDAAVPGFGCSDCRCRSHLFFVGDKSLEGVARLVPGGVILSLRPGLTKGGRICP